MRTDLMLSSKCIPSFHWPNNYLRVGISAKWPGRIYTSPGHDHLGSMCGSWHIIGGLLQVLWWRGTVLTNPWTVSSVAMQVSDITYQLHKKIEIALDWVQGLHSWTFKLQICDYIFACCNISSWWCFSGIRYILKKIMTTKAKAYLHFTINFPEPYLRIQFWNLKCMAFPIP